MRLDGARWSRALRRSAAGHRAWMAAAVAVLAAVPATAQAQGGAAPVLAGWWVGLDTGYAHVEADGGSVRAADDGWVVAFRGGVLLDAHWAVGLELGGIAFEAGDLWDPSEGRTLSDVLVVAEYHDSFHGGWFVQGGAGWVGFQDNSAAGFDAEGDGWGARIGAGYDWILGPGGVVSAAASWEAGWIDGNTGQDWSYDALRLTLGWSARLLSAARALPPR